MRFAIPESNSSLVGLTINCPSLYPIRAAPTGPSNGMPAAMTDSDEPMIVSTHKSCVRSSANGVIVMTNSLTMPLGNIGLSALSVSLAYKITLSDGLPSLLRYCEPQILPAAVLLSLQSIISGKKSLSGDASRAITVAQCR